MTYFKGLTAGAALILMAACGNGDAPTDNAGTAADTAGGASASDSETQADAGTGDGVGDGAGNGGLTRLEQAAEDICRAEEDAAKLAALPEGASFASRGPDGVVVIAYKLDGQDGIHRFGVGDLPQSEQADFDFGVAEHMRFGLRRGDDRSGTGAYRMRDGRFCAVQTDEAVSRAVMEIAQDGEAMRTGPDPQ